MPTSGNATHRPPGPEEPRRPRRLSRESRRAQLVEAAIPVIVEEGLTAFSLDDIAARADVTRNLLYHYFPRGRMDILLAVAERVGQELTEGWLTDEDTPLAERMAANAARFLEHATTPSDAWLLYRRARALDDPELTAIIERYEDALITNISINQLGTKDPPPALRLALKGHLAFTEAVLGEARASGPPSEQVVRMIGEAMLAIIQIGRRLADEAS